MQHFCLFFFQAIPEIDFQNGKFRVSNDTIGSPFTLLTIDLIAQPNHIGYISNFNLLTCDGETRGEFSSFEFSHNTQSWQRWYYCTICNGNKLETVEKWINFNVNQHFPRCFEFVLKWMISLSYLFPKISNTKCQFC